MLVNQRILLASGSSFTDASVELNDLNAGTFNLSLTSSKYLYLGSDLPFNHRFFYISTANTVAANLNVQIWDGSDWNDAVDIIDQTSIAGTSETGEVKASALIGKIKYTAKASGSNGNAVTINIVNDQTGGIALVTVGDADITIGIEDNVTLYSTIITAIRAHTAANALVTVELLSGYVYFNDNARDTTEVGPVSLTGGVDAVSASARVPFAQHGVLSWTTDRNEGWGKAATTEDVNGMENAPIVYDFYWVRISVDATLSGSVLKYLGYKFSEDHDFDNYYPDLNLTTTKAAFTTGKTNWMDQHIMAGEEIVRYLRQKGILVSRSQILDWEQFNLASTHKTAEIIYSAFGSDYEDTRKIASKKFYENVNLGIYQVDRNQSGKLEPQEKVRNIGLARR